MKWGNEEWVMTYSTEGVGLLRRYRTNNIVDWGRMREGDNVWFGRGSQ